MGIVESQEISAKKKAKKSKKASLEEETKSSTTNRKSLIGMISVSEETQTSTKCHKSQIAKYKYLKNRRVERYRLQSIARKIFIGEGERNKLRFAQDFHRTAKCLVIRLNGIGNVGVHRSKQHGKAFYSGLIQCGSIWSCPVCASKIQEKRRIEVCNAIQWAYKNGYKCLLVTLTFPHYAWQECDALLRDQAKALEIFREGRVWQLLKKKIGFLGLIRSLEVTYGKNGWHPHTHEIWIVDGNCDAMSLLDFVKQRWFDACMKVGLIPDDKTKAAKVRGVDLIDNASTSDYLAKQNNNEHWGADREIVFSSKKAAKYGKSPFSLLSSYSDEKNEKAGKLFIKYSLAFKGKRQLFWSHGLKKLVGITEKEDQELVLEQDDMADILALLDSSHWDLVLKEKARAEILDIAERDGAYGLKEWFEKKGLEL